MRLKSGNSVLKINSLMRLLVSALVLVSGLLIWPEKAPAGIAFMQRYRKVCPPNYILVPALAGYTTTNFCVAKYEAKQSGSVAVSTPSGTPWVSITKAAAATACQANGTGYDLISNDQWQSIAQNIEGIGANWSTGTVGSGEINVGNSSGAAASALAADSSDANACSGTGSTCSDTVWNTHRRTHVLSNGEVIWDLAGNVWEWMNDAYSATSSADSYIILIGASTDKTMFGPAGTYANSAPITNTGGFGYAWRTSNGTIRRGGSYGNSANQGAIFAVSLSASTGSTNAAYGFRCVYTP